jgi:hypothetical protein
MYTLTFKGLMACAFGFQIIWFAQTLIIESWLIAKVNLIIYACFFWVMQAFRHEDQGKSPYPRVLCMTEYSPLNIMCLSSLANTRGSFFGWTWVFDRAHWEANDYFWSRDMKSWWIKMVKIRALAVISIKQVHFLMFQHSMNSAARGLIRRAGFNWRAQQVWHLRSWP